MLEVLALLSAQVDWRYSATDPITIGPADRRSATYRDCLAENAAMLSQVTDKEAGVLASTAYIGCSREHKAWQDAYRTELEAARPRISKADIVDQLQSSHVELLAWAEGMIFALQRARYWEGRSPWLKPLQDRLRNTDELLDQAKRPSSKGPSND